MDKKKGTVAIHISFGTTKQGRSFHTSDEFQEYKENDGLQFSQEEEMAPSSPAVKKSSKVIRRESVALPSKCKQLVMRLYASGDTDLKHGMLKEHINGIAHIILSLVSDTKSKYREVLEDALSDHNVNLDNKVVKQIIREFNMTNHDLEGVDGNLLKKGKYKPITDEESAEDPPPSYQQWLQSNGATSNANMQSGNMFGTNPWFKSYGAMAFPFMQGVQQMQQHQQLQTTPVATQSATSVTSNEVITVTCEGKVVSIMIVPPLSMQSTMKQLLLSDSCDEVFMFDEIELSIERAYYYEIDAMDKSKKFTFHSSFLSYTVHDLKHMNGIGHPITINIVRKE